jgi:hypothetical protein
MLRRRASAAWWDVRAIDIGFGHDDLFMVTRLGESMGLP